MRVLITAATKHGATGEIAQVIGEALCERGLDPTVLEPERVDTVDGYDAVVLGSAVYAGHWLKPARELVARCGDALAARPVWLFSSGPIGEPPYPPDEPYDTATLTGLLAPRGHRVFPGRLEPSRLSAPERAVVTAMRAPVGDFRDWPAVEAWAAGIAGAVSGADVAAQA